MKIVSQSYEIIDRNIDALKLIERCGRVCYKSEDKITDESAEKFVKMLVRRGHLSVIEHATCSLHLPPDIFNAVDNFLCSEERHFIWYRRVLPSESVLSGGILSGNLRALKESLVEPALVIPEIMAIVRFLKKHYPWLFYDVCIPPADFSEVSLMTEKQILQSIDNNSKYFSIYRTVKFITNRGITHELVRHRRASFSQESTRYVNYGGNDIQFIEPVWMHNTSLPNWNAYARWKDACQKAEIAYANLLDCGWRPEQAREVLPNSLKTEIIVTAHLVEWKHIFNLRCSEAAHPQMRALMIPVRDEFRKEFPEYFQHEIRK